MDTPTVELTVTLFNQARRAGANDAARALQDALLAAGVLLEVGQCGVAWRRIILA